MWVPSSLGSYISSECWVMTYACAQAGRWPVTNTTVQYTTVTFGYSVACYWSFSCGVRDEVGHPLVLLAGNRGLQNSQFEDPNNNTLTALLGRMVGGIQTRSLDSINIYIYIYSIFTPVLIFFMDFARTPFPCAIFTPAICWLLFRGINVSIGMAGGADVSRLVLHALRGVDV